MKKCIRCGEIKAISQYYKDSAMRDGHLNCCKACKNESNNKRNKFAQAYGRELLRRFKLMKGCIHCGYKAHHAGLEFNHRNPQEKTECVSNMAKAASCRKNTKSKDKVKFELSKCDVVCALCHNIITFEQRERNWA